jgi:hypothetical protein
MNHSKLKLMQKTFYLASSLLLIIVVLILAEVGLRFFKSTYTQLQYAIYFTDDERNYVLKPNNITKFTGLHSELKDTVIWRINAQGIRDNNFINPKLPDKYRIATYGNRETFGWSVNVEQTFKKQLENLDKRFNCINLGVPGYNIAQVAAHIEATKKMINPDLIIYIINPNDFDPPLHFNKTISNFELSRRILYVYEMYQVIRNEHRRCKPDTISNFMMGLLLIKHFCETAKVPLVIGLINQDDSKILCRNEEISEYFFNPNINSLRTIVFSQVFNNYLKIDYHLCPECHSKIAQILYEQLIKLLF